VLKEYMNIGDLRRLDLHSVEWTFSVNQRSWSSPYTTSRGIEANISLALTDNLMVSLNRVPCLNVVHSPATENLQEFTKGGCLCNMAAVLASFLQSVNIPCIREECAHAVLKAGFLTRDQFSHNTPVSNQSYSLKE
jgi:hypothetical protein